MFPEYHFKKTLHEIRQQIYEQTHCKASKDGDNSGREGESKEIIPPGVMLEGIYIHEYLNEFKYMWINLFKGMTQVSGLLQINEAKVNRVKWTQRSSSWIATCNWMLGLIGIEWERWRTN